MFNHLYLNTQKYYLCKTIKLFMKKSVYVLAFALLAFAGCKNDLNVQAPYKDIPVVYGLLDQNDSVQYIKVNKAFEGTADAYTMASQFDSINYPVHTITVQLKDHNTGTIVTLDTTTAIPLDPGIFSYPYQILYRTPYSTPLNANDQYDLIITNEKNGTVVTGSTTLLPDVSIPYPNLFLSSNPLPMNFSEIFINKVQWSSNAQALIYQLTLRFYYNEIDSAKNDTSSKYVDWVFPQHTSPSLEAGFSMEDDYTGMAFLQFLKGSISPAAGSIKRVPVDVQVRFTSGSRDLNTYIELSQPSLGINQEKPAYSDVKNAIGIFSARHTQTVFKPLGNITIDSLVNSPTVSQIRFRYN